MVTLLETEIIITVLSSQYWVIVKAVEIHILLQLCIKYQIDIRMLLLHKCPLGNKVE